MSYKLLSKFNRSLCVLVLDYRKFKLNIKLSFRLISGDRYLEISPVWVPLAVHGT